MKPRLGLISARENAGLTQEDFAYDLAETGLSPGVTTDTVSRWERGVFNIAQRHLAAITQVLGFSSLQETIERIDPFGTAGASSAGGPVNSANDTTHQAGERGPGEWVISVDSLPWQPCIAYAGLGGRR